MRKMKDSGIAWIGEIPEAWSREKIFRVFQTIGSGTTPKSGNPDYYNGDVHWVQSGDINGGIITDTKSSVTDAAIKHFSALKIYDAPFIIMAMYGASIGNLSISKINGCVNQACCVMKDCNQDMKYSFYSLKTAKDFLMWKGIGGGQPNISQDTIKQLWIPLPPLDEQHRIAAFLDEKCAHIDAVIEKTRASIDEYKKLKQAIITRAVTKGLRQGRKMKDSGIEWIGFIPMEWTLWKLKYMFHIQKIIAGKEGYTILSITQKGIRVKDIASNEGQVAADYSNYQLVHKGDFAMNHMDLLTGWVDISKYDGVTSPDYRVFTLDNKEANSASYYLYLMQMCYSNKIFYGLGQGVSGFGRWRLQADKFLNFYIPVPPLPEQQEIAAYLDAKTAAIDRLIAKKEQLIAEMQSCKKSLIYEVVTGKREAH